MNEPNRLEHRFFADGPIARGAGVGFVGPSRPGDDWRTVRIRRMPDGRPSISTALDDFADGEEMELALDDRGDRHFRRPGVQAG